MAEHFEKPKKFTAEWFGYIWHYYKVHFICIAIAIVLIAITVAEFVNAVRADVEVNYIATNVMEAETAEQLSQRMEEFVFDVNEDGKVHVPVAQLNFTRAAMQDGEQVMVLENKLMITFASPEQMLFIFDETMLEDVISMNAAEGIFVPVSQWCQKEVEESMLYSYNGENYAVNLSKSEILTQLGLDASNMYLAVRENYQPEDKTLQIKYEACVELANALVK